MEILRDVLEASADPKRSQSTQVEIATLQGGETTRLEALPEHCGYGARTSLL